MTVVKNVNDKFLDKFDDLSKFAQSLGYKNLGAFFEAEQMRGGGGVSFAEKNSNFIRRLVVRRKSQPRFFEEAAV